MSNYKERTGYYEEELLKGKPFESTIEIDKEIDKKLKRNVRQDFIKEFEKRLKDDIKILLVGMSNKWGLYDGNNTMGLKVINNRINEIIDKAVKEFLE